MDNTFKLPLLGLGSLLLAFPRVQFSQSPLLFELASLLVCLLCSGLLSSFLGLACFVKLALFCLGLARTLLLLTSRLIELHGLKVCLLFGDASLLLLRLATSFRFSTLGLAYSRSFLCQTLLLEALLLLLGSDTLLLETLLLKNLTESLFLLEPDTLFLCFPPGLFLETLLFGLIALSLLFSLDLRPGHSKTRISQKNTINTQVKQLSRPWWGG